MKKAVSVALILGLVSVSFLSAAGKTDDKPAGGAKSHLFSFLQTTNRAGIQRTPNACRGLCAGDSFSQFVSYQGYF